MPSALNRGTLGDVCTPEARARRRRIAGRGHHAGRTWWPRVDSDTSVEAAHQPGGRLTIMADRAIPADGALLADWAMRPASMADVELVAELRATVLRADLERL